MLAVWACVLAACVDDGEGREDGLPFSLAADVHHLFEGERIFPGNELRQGRQTLHRVVDVGIDGEGTAGVDGPDVHVLLEKEVRSVGSSAPSAFSYLLHESADGGKRWQSREKPSRTQLLGIVSRNGDRIEVTRETNCLESQSGCLNQEEGYRAYFSFETGRTPVGGSNSPVLFQEPPVARNGWLAGNATFWDGATKVTEPIRISPRALQPFEFDRSRGWKPNGDTADGLTWGGLSQPSGQWLDKEESYHPSNCLSLGASEGCFAPVDWPRVLGGSDVFAHAFTDGTLALVGPGLDFTQVLPLTDPVDWERFTDLGPVGAVLRPNRLQLHQRWGGALAAPLEGWGAGGGGLVRLLDLTANGWEEIVYPTKLCAGKCPSDVRPLLEFAVPLPNEGGPEEWLLLFSLNWEHAMKIDGEKIFATRYHLFATRRKVERRPLQVAAEGLRIVDLTGPVEPAGPAAAACFARHSCGAYGNGELCSSSWVVPDRACPGMQTLLALVDDGGGTCDDWLAPRLDDCPPPSVACNAATGTFGRCEDGYAVRCQFLDGEYTAKYSSDCELLGLPCTLVSDDFPMCQSPERPDSERPLVTSRSVCHLGRYLSWNAAGTTDRHWLDCNALGFDGCGWTGVHWGAYCLPGAGTGD